MDNGDKQVPILADEVAALVCEALDINPHLVKRIVLDLPAGEVITAYVEMIGSQRFLEIKWKLDGAKVEFADKESSVIDDYNRMKAMSG